MTTQTAAQRLADSIDRFIDDLTCKKASAELRRLDRIEHAWQVWHDKTEWVQKTSEGDELGMHRADALRQRIEKLEAANAELMEVLRHIEGATMDITCDRRSIREAARAAIAKHRGAA